MVRGLSWVLSQSAISVGLIRQEHFFDWLAKEFAQLDCQGQAGIVLTRLDRVYGLPGNTDSLRQVFLRPIVLSPQHLQTVLHYSNLVLTVVLVPASFIDT